MPRRYNPPFHLVIGATRASLKLGRRFGLRLLLRSSTDANLLHIGLSLSQLLKRTEDRERLVADQKSMYSLTCRLLSWTL